MSFIYFEEQTNNNDSLLPVLHTLKIRHCSKEYGTCSVDISAPYKIITTDTLTFLSKWQHMALNYIISKVDLVCKISPIKCFNLI